MNSHNLTKEQARQIHAALVLALRYRLAERLNARRLSPDDPLYRAAFKAQAAMGELVMALHYIMSEMGERPFPLACLLRGRTG